MNFSKKDMPLYIALGVLSALVVCLCMLILVFNFTSKTPFRVGNTVTVSGVVLDYNGSCIFDGVCSLTIHDDHYGEVNIVTSSGLGDKRCNHKSELGTSLDRLVGKQVEAKGLVVSKRSLKPCETGDYVKTAPAESLF